MYWLNESVGEDAFLTGGEDFLKPLFKNKYKMSNRTDKTKNIKTKNGKGTVEFIIEPCIKGFVAETTTEKKISEEYFHFKEISEVIYHFDVGIEIIFHSGKRRVFYNDLPGESSSLFNLIHTTMLDWMKSIQN